MTIRVEFFGLARTRADVASIELQASRLRDITEQLEQRFPELSNTCFESGELRDGWIININGRSFVRDLDHPLDADDCVLLMSADVGG